MISTRNFKALPKHAVTRAAFILLALGIFMTILAACGVADESSNQDSPYRGVEIPVASELKSFYDSHGGLSIFGYPITDPYEDLDEDGRLVQYFQKMRLEFNSVSDQVSIFPLGEWAYEGTSDTEELAQMVESESQGDTKESITIEDEFLTFYRAVDGQTLFGQPISPQVKEGETRVQYFENARLEWHPEASLDDRVQVGLLGEAHYRLVGLFENPGRSRPLDSAAVQEADVQSNVIAPILYQGDEQTLFVNVVTPEGQRPVAGVTVDAAITYNGQTEKVELPATDGAGQTKKTLTLDDIEPGQKVQVDISVSGLAGTEIGATTLSFMSWW